MQTTLSEKEKSVLQYLKNAIRKDNKQIDLRNDGIFAETMLNPLVSIMTPIIEIMDRTRLIRSLENADRMTKEEMDQVGREYDTIRISGERSTVIAQMIFNDLPDDGVLVIATGERAVTSTGKKFKVLGTVMYDETSIAPYYNAETYKYSIPVEFVSIDVGSDKNINVGELTTFESTAPQGFEEIVNEEPGIGGRDEEDNVSYANRILSSLWAVNLGVERGYENFINSIEGVRESLIVGYRHPLMKRDTIGNVEIPGVKMHPKISEKHWGSKIDIYVIGVMKKEYEEEIKVKKDKNGDKYIKLAKKPVHEIRGITVTVESIGAIEEEVDYERLVITDYSFIRDEEFETLGTLEEDSYVIINDDRIEAGMTLVVTYIYNGIPEFVDYHMYHNDTKNRPPTADVKTKIAKKKYLFGSVVVGLESDSALRSADKSTIKRQVAEKVDSSKFGEQLQLSDLVESIYGKKMLGMNRVDYIDLPYQFILTEKKNRYIYYCLSNEQAETMASLKLPFALLDSIKDYQSTITTFDFFDVLYVLSRKMNDNIEILKEEGFQLMLLIEPLKKAAETYLRSGAIKQLSPAYMNIPENEHAMLGDLYVYDYEDNADSTEWERRLYLMRNISETVDNQDGTKMTHVVYYVLMLTYIFYEGKEVDKYSNFLIEELGIAKE